MTNMILRRLACCMMLFLLSATALAAEPISLLQGPDQAQRIKPSSDQVTFSAGDDGVSITIAPGKEGYPGITLTPADGETWNLSQYGHVTAKVINTGDKAVGLTLRVDDDGDWKNNPWNAEQVHLKPGATGEIKLIFGYSWGHKPAYKLNAAKVARILLFSGTQKDGASFRLESLVADGPAGEKPPVDPNSIRIVPPDGKMLGEGVALDAGQLKTSGAVAKAEGGAAIVNFENKKDAWLKIAPPQGRWDLRQLLQVRVAVENVGTTPIAPRVRLDSNPGNTPWISAAAPLGPGERTEIIVPFSSGNPWTNQEPKTSGDRFGSDAVSAVLVAPSSASGEAALKIASIVAEMPPAPKLPDWLGKRPPVPGDWTLTLEDNFDGNAIDAAIWNIYGENYWDKRSHFSKENVIVGDGVARLRFTKERGHQNDDPNHKRVTDYATGFLDTYGKWVQRYGYFESRMKLPTAPGLWPAFWMMPDRGGDAGPQWKRQDTRNGGMEFDIMEHLTRWGPYRYTIAMHWDGYEKEHKSTGATIIYFQPDADGYVTNGVLWTPGELVYYCNGREVARYTNERVSNVPGCLMFTLPMGGWDNSPLDDSKLPDDFVVDYVRCWQRADLKSDADGRFAVPNVTR